MTYMREGTQLRFVKYVKSHRIYRIFAYQVQEITYFSQYQVYHVNQNFITLKLKELEFSIG